MQLKTFGIINLLHTKNTLKIKKTRITFSIILLGLTCSAQKTFTGKLDYWPHGKADVITVKNGPSKIGSINEEGTVTIPLEDKYLAKTKEELDATNTNSEQWKATMLTVGNAFGCNNETLELENTDQPITKLSSYGVFDLADMEKKKKYGFFIAANSKEFAEAYTSFGQKNAAKGFAIDYYYVSEPAQVKGTCSSIKYTGNEDENFEMKMVYNLDLKKGWNIIQYQVEELFTAENGKTYAAVSGYETLENFPDNTQYIFFEE